MVVGRLLLAALTSLADDETAKFHHVGVGMALPINTLPARLDRDGYVRAFVRACVRACGYAASFIDITDLPFARNTGEAVSSASSLMPAF
jgi:hypothetical protein